MLKKIFALMMICAFALMTGCGSDKIVGSPDKAVLAYAEIAMTGSSDNMQAAGFSEDDGKAIRFNVARAFIESLENVAPLSDASAEQVADIYFNKLKGAMNFQVKVVKDDPERPIVEITTTPIDQGETARASVTENDELLALVGMVGKLKSDGADDESLKENADVQKLAVDALTKYIENIKFASDQTYQVPCSKVTGSDKNVHWAPADSELFINFLTGRN